jgi:hypothetical protein
MNSINVLFYHILGKDIDVEEEGEGDEEEEEPEKKESKKKRKLDKRKKSQYAMSHSFPAHPLSHISMKN